MKNSSKFTNLVTSVITVMFLLPWTCQSATYSMQNYCDRTLSLDSSNNHQLKLSLDDVYIYNQNNLLYTYTCKTTINHRRYSSFYQYSYNYERIMFYFDSLNLDCEDGHLEFYDDDNERVAGLEEDICGSNKPKGVLTADTVAIYYYRKREQIISNIFTIIFTAYGRAPCENGQYDCDNSRCIDTDIAYNEYDSCGDDFGSRNTEIAIIIGAIVGSVSFLVSLVSLVVCCICCKRKQRGAVGNVQVPASQNAKTGQTVFTMNQGVPYSPKQAKYPGASAIQLMPIRGGQQVVYTAAVVAAPHKERRQGLPPVYTGSSPQYGQ